MLKTQQIHATFVSALLQPAAGAGSAGKRRLKPLASPARAEAQQPLKENDAGGASGGRGPAALEPSVTRGDINSNTEVGEKPEAGAEGAVCCAAPSRDGGKLAGNEDPQDQQAGQQRRRRRRHLSAGQSISSWPEAADCHQSESRPSSADCGAGFEDKQGPGLATEQAGKLETEAEPEKPFEAELVWTNIILFVILHSCLPVGAYMIYSRSVHWQTLLFSLFASYASGLGVTGGSHRLWSHKAYRAKWPVQLFLMLLQTMAGQNSIYTWSRDHRVHHKFSETDADPHNIKRGFFFAHMGWLCCRKHPEVKAKGKLIDMSDLEANPFVMFQHRHFWWLSALYTVLIPTLIPVLAWHERFWVSFTFAFMIRYLVTLHGTWCVNSAAHYFGDRPYDQRIEARESPYVIYNGLGEGFHNYHHTFPYDYAAGEFGKYLNITTTFIDLCASLGLVYNRRIASRESVEKRRLRTGDGSDQLTAGSDKCIGEEKEEEALEALEALGAPTTSGRPLSNIIHELPYISGLTSMKYTM